MLNMYGTDEDMSRTDRIEGERVSLRLATEADTDRLVAWRNSPHIMKTFLRQEPLTRETHERWRASQIETGRAVQFIIERNEDGLPLGSQYYMHIDREKKSAEFGIYIGEETALGCGYGREAAALALDYAFRELGLDEILLRVREENRRAVTMYEKLGFHICEVPEDEDETEGIRVLFMKKERA